MPDEELILGIARRLRIAGNGITRVKDRNASVVGLTSGQADALRYIAEHPGCRISDLRDHMGASHQAACGIADRLAAKGLVDATASSTDGRAKSLTVSSAGRTVLERFLEMGVENNARVLNGLTEGELQMLYDDLGIIIGNIRDEGRSTDG